MRKFLVLLTTIILIGGIIGMPVKINADSELLPDIVTDRIIPLPSYDKIINELTKGTLGIVSYSYKDYMGFDVPGGNIGTDFLIETKITVPVTTPVALRLKNGRLYVYLSNIKVVAIKWNTLSVPPTESAFEEKSWFPKFIPLQIVKAVPTGVETEINYCCNPPVKKISYGYILYLTINKDPYNPPEELSGDPTLYLNKYFMTEVMIPDYLKPSFETLIKNKDFLWLGLSGDINIDYNYIYFWSH